MRKFITIGNSKQKLYIAVYEKILYISYKYTNPDLLSVRKT